MVLLAAASALMASACGTTEIASRTASSSILASEAPPGNFAGMLARHGIGIAIPSQGKFVLVNIPSFELVALQDGALVLRSRVVVGRPVTPTPELLSSMFSVKFNPSWMPTPSMVRNEGARYVAPGPRNPLGSILFELDNDQLVFLHDTNDKVLFNRPQRALSHGCVRVEQARSLAAWALGVSEGEVDTMISRRTTYSVPLSEQIPVSFVYYTHFPDERGQPLVHPDIYTHRPVAGHASPTREPAKSACQDA
ncbi:MAG: L,D-transpeptidase family protein [Reyranella sp.]|nr:L,D-transpeptidase family protein [Reyranella sp.]